MKKIFNLALAALTVVAVLSCKEDDPGTGSSPVLSMEWDSNPSFAAVELSASMDVNISITAEAGIETFVVSVDSPVLSPAIAMITSDHSSDMDLIGDTALATILDGLTGGGIPTGDNLYGKTEVHLDISSFVPLILTLSPENGSDHSFVLKVSDKEGQTLTKTLTFHYTGESSVSVSDIDLWANSASVKVVATEAVASPSVYFGKKGSDSYVELVPDSAGNYMIAAEYEKSENEGGQMSIHRKTGQVSMPETHM